MNPQSTHGTNADMSQTKREPSDETTKTSSATETNQTSIESTATKQSDTADPTGTDTEAATRQPTDDKPVGAQ